RLVEQQRARSGEEPDDDRIEVDRPGVDVGEEGSPVDESSEPHDRSMMHDAGRGHLPVVACARCRIPVPSPARDARAMDGDPLVTNFNLADLFEQAVDAFAERECLVANGKRRTYAELDARANQLAHHLAAHGVRPGDHVGIYAQNCVEWVETLWAV